MTPENLQEYIEDTKKMISEIPNSSSCELALHSSSVSCQCVFETLSTSSVIFDWISSCFIIIDSMGNSISAECYINQSSNQFCSEEWKEYSDKSLTEPAETLGTAPFGTDHVLAHSHLFRKFNLTHMPNAIHARSNFSRMQA